MFVAEFPEEVRISQTTLFPDYLLKLVDSKFNPATTDKGLWLRRQEDAQEFFTFLLDGIHEELISLVKKNKDKSSKEEEEWNEVGKKQKVATILVVSEFHSFY